MFCDYCGNKLREGAKFCNICGEPVTEVSDKPITHNEPKTSQSENNPYNLSSSSVTLQQPSPTEQRYSDSQPQPVIQYQQQVYQPQLRPYYAPGTHPYHRLGGFLMFTVVISYISGVSSFINVISTIISYSGLLKSMGNWFPGGLKTWFILNMIIYSILQLSAGIISISFANRIRRKESDFLHFIQSSSLTLMIIMIIWCMISFIWIKRYDQYGVVSWGSIIGILIAMVIALIIGVIISSVYYGCSVRVRTYMGSDDYLKQSVFNKNSHPIPADGSDQPNVGVRPRAKVSFDPNTQWVCPQCQRVNSNYVTTCQCGNPKPQIDLSKSWVCKNCGSVNMGNLHKCTSCGSLKNEDNSWTCAHCGARNAGNATTCSACYSPKATSKSSKQAVGMQDWQCPQCKKENPGYVTTCTCGCPSSMGIKLSSYSNGNAPRTPGENEWQCPACGKINANYVGTCGCGQMRP